MDKKVKKIDNSTRRYRCCVCGKVIEKGETLYTARNEKLNIQSFACENCGEGQLISLW